MLRVAINAALILTSAVVTRAQETVTLEVRFADPVLAPGQTQQVEVWASFAPEVGTMVPWTTSPGAGQLLRLMAFGGAYFDIVNRGNAQTGSYSNLTLNPWLTLFNMPGTTQPNGDVVQILARQLYANATENPIHLWTAEWTPTNYEPRSVTLEPFFRSPPEVKLGLSTIPVVQQWAGVTEAASFQVVPSPGVFSLLAAAALPATRRRRR